VIGRARPAPARVTIEARAKLNLALAVGPGRADGFHDIATIFQSVSLADTLVVERRPRGFTFVLRRRSAAARGGRAGAAVPAGADNLVLRAARLLREHRPRIGGARFTLTKRIPARAGLGGGSADAAAALVGLAAVHGVRLPVAERAALAARLGSDVPFAITGGTALGLGRGERLRRLRLARPFRAVIALPAWTVSTAAAYDRLDRRKNALTAWPAHLRSVRSLARRRVIPEVAMSLGNTFESVLGGRAGDFEELRAELCRCGASPVRLTGSGSAVFGLLPKGVRGKDFVRSVGVPVPLFLVRSAGRGLRVSALK
jgi:4-diphosphocytidyl-2-C-methyl-D-erythritol kinase